MSVWARWPALFALLLVATPAQAQATAVSFAEARAQAERLAPIVRLAGKHIEIARAEVDVAGTLQNPTLTVQSATKSAHLGTFVSVPLPLFGQRGTGIDA